MSTFKFNPLEFNFRPLSDFPELIRVGLQDWIGSGEVFIKISCIGRKEDFARKVFWYKICKYSHPGIDDRVEFYYHAFDEDKPNITRFEHPRKVYFGTVASKEFATLLLYNLLGTGQNDAVITFGKQRTEQDLYMELRSMWP